MVLASCIATCLGEGAAECIPVTACWRPPGRSISDHSFRAGGSSGTLEYASSESSFLVHVELFNLNGEFNQWWSAAEPKLEKAGQMFQTVLLTCCS